jgi:carboxymethylenebutenolidase
MRERTETYSTGGTAITIECFEPEGVAAHPAIIALHGSNGMVNGAALVRHFSLPVVRMGFAVYLPHYFERTGTVRSDPQTSRRNFTAWMQTVADAVGFASIQPSVDSSRIGVVGVSLGAFLGLSVASRDTRIGAVVDLFGGLPAQIADALTRMPPTLIVHGEDDRIVPVAEAHRLRDLLAARGVPHEVKLYPGEGHILSPLAALDAAGRTLRFLSAHLAP